MSNAPGDYQSYLLRLWRVRTNKHTWRASLENVETGDLTNFASLDKLIEFLQSLGAEQQETGKGLRDELDN